MSEPKKPGSIKPIKIPTSSSSPSSLESVPSPLLIRRSIAIDSSKAALKLLEAKLNELSNSPNDINELRTSLKYCQDIINEWQTKATQEEKNKFKAQQTRIKNMQEIPGVAPPGPEFK